jgi:hypothetical protein
MSLGRAGDLAVFAILLTLFLSLSARNVSPEPYVYDEADYMYAASLGFAANWTDTPTMSIADFVRTGLGRANRSKLSEEVRNRGDVLFYRHFHGPLFHYLLIPISRLDLSERAVRGVMITVPCATLAIVFFGCLSLFSINAAALASALFLTSYSVLASTELAPHHLFALFTIASLLLLLKALVSRKSMYWYASSAAAALACATLEIGFTLVIAIAICAFIERSKCLLQCAAVFVATILVVWPAAIFRWSLVKSGAAMAYLAISRSNAWGNMGLIDTWRARILNSPLEWTLLVFAIILGFRWMRRYYPLALFAALAILATLRVLTDAPRYALVFMPVLDLLAGLALVPFIGPLRRPASLAVTLAVAGLYGGAWLQAARQPRRPNPRSAAVVTYIHQNELENKAVLAPQTDVPTLHYYFPRMRLRAYFGPAPAASDFAGSAGSAVIPALVP